MSASFDNAPDDGSMPTLSNPLGIRRNDTETPPWFLLSDQKVEWMRLSLTARIKVLEAYIRGYWLMHEVAYIIMAKYDCVPDVVAAREYLENYKSKLIWVKIKFSESALKLVDEELVPCDSILVPREVIDLT